MTQIYVYGRRYGAGMSK